LAKIHPKDKKKITTGGPQEAVGIRMGPPRPSNDTAILAAILWGGGRGIEAKAGSSRAIGMN